MKFLVALAILAAPVRAAAADIVLQDPSGDDNGPGAYVYPTDPVYERGSFDLRKVTVSPGAETTEFKVRLGSKIRDPWRSKEWDGNGFSLQMVFVFLDTTPGVGRTESVPGLNVKFDPKQAWDKVVIISPQPPKRIRSEIEGKAKGLAADVVVPVKTRARGKDLVAVVKTKELGGAPAATWGYQVVVQSNEGYPASTDVLTRKVNEYEGQHRFGGGSDYDCDPHALDVLVAPAAGGDGEKAGQHKVLGAFTCDAEGKGAQAVLPMVVPAHR